MATPTATEMVEKIRTALLANPAGVVSVTVDGQTVTWNRKQALEELLMWEKRANSEGGKRPRISSINLGGSW